MRISINAWVRQLVFCAATFCGLCLAAFGIGVGVGGTPVHGAEKESGVLDLSEFYRQPNRALSQFKSFTGRQVIDGLPFQIDGQVRLYGRTPASYGEGTYPYTVSGIRIGRKFDDLYLIHHATWPDVQGQAVAYVCLNYANGTVHVFPICYGVHVRDWRNLPSYEKETMTDPDTTVCWRREPVTYKAPMRIFKSRLTNPSPNEVVETMSIISARSLAAYHLLAATVANRNEEKKVPLEGDRHFDGEITVRVVDDTTGRPIPDALVLPSMNVYEVGVVGSPFRTALNGEGRIPYPTANTRSINITVEKAGYKEASKYWNESFPKECTIRMKPRWNEIDAVELVGKDATRQWASHASASSTYAVKTSPTSVETTRSRRDPREGSFTTYSSPASDLLATVYQKRVIVHLEGGFSVEGTPVQTTGGFMLMTLPKLHETTVVNVQKIIYIETVKPAHEDILLPGPATIKVNR